MENKTGTQGGKEEKKWRVGGKRKYRERKRQKHSRESGGKETKIKEKIHTHTQRERKDR